MGTGYTRNDTPNNIADGNVINASDLDGEFDAIQSAFNASTGHSHDGTTGEGPQIDTGGIADDAVTLGTKTTGNYVATGAVSGVGLSGSASSEGATFTITSNATSANTASTIVARDASGNFSAGTITASLTGTASNAALLDSIDSTSFLRSDAADTKTSGDLSFSDNVKAIFGAGSDLQIYHDGSHSYVLDNGTGNLNLRGTSLRLSDASGTHYLVANSGAEVSLTYSGSEKLATTATGIDVTGTVTADAATLSGTAPVLSYSDTDNSITAQIGSGTSDFNIATTSAHNLDIRTNNTRRMVVESDGDISFYDSTGVSQGLFYQASTQRLGLGTTSPSAAIHATTATAGYTAKIVNTNGAFDANGLLISAGTASTEYALNVTNTSGTTNFMTVKGNGNVGIGTVSPQAKAEISGGLDNRLRINSTDGTTSNNYGIDFSTAGTVRGGIRYNAGNNYLAFYGYDNAERMRIDSSGNLLVGTTTTTNLIGGTGNDGVALTPNHIEVGRSGGAGLFINRYTSDGDIAEFRKDGTTVGSISVTGSGTTYNTTSDIRLKTDIEPIADATDRLMAMNAVSHKWKADPDADAVVGFIAQEMQEIVPEAVSKGEGEDDMWSMDYGRITPVLVAALQDAHKKIEKLEQRIADMENN
jgi:hypothetical protein